MENLLTSPLKRSQPPRLRAVVELVDGQLKVWPICDSDADERRILDALRFVGKDEAISVQFFFNETKSNQQVSRFWLSDSRFENPVVGVEKRLPYLPQD